MNLDEMKRIREVGEQLRFGSGATVLAPKTPAKGPRKIVGVERVTPIVFGHLGKGRTLALYDVFCPRCGCPGHNRPWWES